MNNSWPPAGVVAAILMGAQVNSARSPGEVVNLMVDGGSGGEIKQPPTASFTFSCTGLTCSFNGSGSTADDGATGSRWRSVTATAPGGGGGASLSGASSNNGVSWTAIVTLSGSVGASTSGNWSIGISDGCSITSGTSCSFSLGGIPKRTGSVTYTDGGSLGSVTINKP